MIREIAFYEDSDGFCEVGDALRKINKADPRHTRHIRNKIDLLRTVEDIHPDATRSGLVKRPSAHVYVLIVSGRGGFGFRLPFFVPECREGRLIVFTHLTKRRGLDDDYASLIAAAAARRQDWIERNCEGTTMRGDDLFRELEAENPLPSAAAAEIDAPYVLAANVRRARKALGLSQGALACALEVTQPRIAQIERGDANLRIGTLARLAAALNCEMRDLLAPPGEAEPIADTLRNRQAPARRVA